ncbi:HsdM family class I SAM-dependent methyltransferase [Delftia acidovorans]|uniref:HsdM family class I SAM-dependent methyltransferase n=1 Tax=Delftia acidovorans TaxID=80866 RepID=UPI00192AAB1C|nr:N-6 DNA methylase [Delftia acidovorans]
MANVSALLSDFGADPDMLHLLDADEPALLPYATLLAARRTSGSILEAVSAVYEWQGAPLLFVVTKDALQTDHQLHQIRRLLAMRGDAPYLGVVSAGRLEVYSIALDKRAIEQARIDMGDDDPSITIARLGNVRPDAASGQSGWISNVVLSLLTRSISRLIEMKSVTHEDAISLVGRALFTRFLADRDLLPQHMGAARIPASLFDQREAAQTTSLWLDTTFNGDLLPLSPEIFEVLPASGFGVLGDILRRAPDSQLFLGWEEKWDHLDFSHIPVGVLSQAYELYLREHAPSRQKREGGFYTPRPIADLMVRASFRALERNDTVRNAKVLDPAAGAGVFLLTAFRELVAGRWRADGKRPETRTLRSILYRQVTGLDVNEAALQFSALGLYLMSIELDPNPRPVDKLRFENLRGTVLHKLASGGIEEGCELGSLGPLADERHVGQYDLVIGNPPWSSATGLRDWKLVRATVARIAASRRVSQAEPPLPNEVLDLPFVWRAMEWAKPGGQIALALHARLLFQQGDGMAEARQALFEALNVTSVINGTALRQTKVWPEISAPFCVLFATNDVPGTGAGFRLINPHLEDSLNNAGVMRVDALSSEIVAHSRLGETPDILKILFRGTKADLAIVERIRMQGHPTLETFWRKSIGVTERGGHLLGSGNGYQRLRKSSEVRRTDPDGLPGTDASRLLGLPEIDADSFTPISIDIHKLSPFTQQRVHRIRSFDIFSGPLALVHKSPPAATGRIGVAISETGLVFNQTFYGYSPVSHADAGTLVRYLAMVLGSKLAVWMALVTSGEFGFEREAIEKATLDRIPIPDFDATTPTQRAEVVKLFEQLRNREASWDDVDAWVSRLYGLGSRDLQVIADTLAFNLPFAYNKHYAQQMPSVQDQKRFCRILTDELLPWCQRLGTTLNAAPMPQLAGCPWAGIVLRTGDSRQDISQRDWNGLLRAADETASTEVLVRTDSTGMLIGRLAQQRYWSDTQARLLAQHIVWGHMDVLKGSL